LICNWKENKTLPEILKFKEEIQKEIPSHIKLVICPPFPFLPILHSKYYQIGAQDVSCYPQGNYTGEVSAAALKSLDVSYVMIGHHEREMYFLESVEQQKLKIKNALEQNLKVVIPVGETLMEYQLDKTKEVVEQKLSSLLLDIPIAKRKNIIIAYEPIWRVGNSLPLNKKEIIQVIINIKKWLQANQYPNIPVLYGGGLQQEDIEKLSEIEGFLLGNLSLNVEKMCQIIKKL